MILTCQSRSLSMKCWTGTFVTAVRAVTKVPVRYAVLTHWHPDHAMAMMCFGPRPFALAAHRNAIRALSMRGQAVAKSLAANAQSPVDRAAFERCRIAPPEREIIEPTSFDLGGRTGFVRSKGRGARPARAWRRGARR
jgi:glyoxylase-like metal-dependent hydrolase (beta-lactamase superfamily II)